MEGGDGHSSKFNRFLLWEQTTRDTIDFKTIYVDMVGDLIAGLMLSQIVYWHLPDKAGQSKLRVFKDGYYWIAKAREAWYDEIRVTPKQVDRGLKLLEEKGIIATQLYKFNGAPTKHLRIVREGFLKRWHEVLEQRGKSILPKGENPTAPKGEMDVDESDKSLTETTSEITFIEEEIAAPAAPAPPQAAGPPEQEEKPKPKPRRTKKPTKPTPAAVKTFREATARYPAKSWYGDIESVVGEEPDDLKLWYRICHAYVGLGWNPTNVKGMLDYFQRGEIPEVKGNGNAKNGRGRHRAHQGAVQRTPDADGWIKFKGPYSLELEDGSEPLALPG